MTDRSAPSPDAPACHVTPDLPHATGQDTETVAATGAAEEALGGGGLDEGVMQDLRRCGSVVDHLVAYLVEEGMPRDLIASSLLGGAVGMMVQDEDPETTVRMLETVIAGVRAGEARRDD